MSVIELLKQWLKFSDDVKANDAAGDDWLDSLRERTKFFLERSECFKVGECSND